MRRDDFERLQFEVREAWWERAIWWLHRRAGIIFGVGFAFWIGVVCGRAMQ